jgi:metal-responsive CopG/Arc/MetJ family transcriptional regulator
MTERLSVSVPKEIIDKARELAKSEKRSLSNMVSVLLEEALKEKKAA